MGLKPTGVGSVCVKPTEGGGFAGLREQIDELLKADNDKYDENKDSFGFSWIARTAARTTSPTSSPTCTPSTRPSPTPASARPCCARSSCSVTRPTRRSAGLPLQARHLVSVRPHRPGPARQPARARAEGGDRQRSADGTRSVPLVPGLGCTGAVISPRAIAVMVFAATAKPLPGVFHHFEGTLHDWGYLAVGVSCSSRTSAFRCPGRRC